MEFRASHRNAGITPRKTRYVIDLIRGEDVNRAFEILDFTRKRGSAFVRKVLGSAVANASQAVGVNVNKLYVREARVDGGPVVPARFMPGPMGRALPIRRRLCHIHVVLAEREPSEAAAEAGEPKAEPAKAKPSPRRASERKAAPEEAGKKPGGKGGK